MVNFTRNASITSVFDSNAFDGNTFDIGIEAAVQVSSYPIGGMGRIILYPSKGIRPIKSIGSVRSIKRISSRRNK